MKKMEIHLRTQNITGKVFRKIKMKNITGKVFRKLKWNNRTGNTSKIKTVNGTKIKETQPKCLQKLQCRMS